MDTRPLALPSPSVSRKSIKVGRPMFLSVLLTTQKQKNTTRVFFVFGRGRWIRFSRASRKTVHRTVFSLTANTQTSLLAPNSNPSFAYQKKPTLMVGYHHGRGRWIRTNEVTESESVALPLGDTPV